MYSKAFITIIYLTLFFFVSASISAEVTNFRQEIIGVTQCNDGIDNDGDGGIDFASDDDCTDWGDPSEEGPVNPSPNPTSTPVVPPEGESESVSQESANNDTIAKIDELLSREFSWSALGRILDIHNIEDVLGLQENANVALTLAVFFSLGFVVSIAAAFIIIYFINSSAKISRSLKNS